MFYVPMVPPQPPSPRTWELADLLGRVIEEYERHHPSVSGSEVRAALQMAGRSSRTSGPATALWAGVALAVLVAGIAAFLFARGGLLSGGGIPWIAVQVVLVGVVVAAFLVKRAAGK